MGRPLKEIDGEQVFKLARLGCTQETIGQFCGCSDETIRRRFGNEYELGRGALKMSLHRAQFKNAMAGCATMQIHLGKQYLGQSDKVDLTSKGEQIGATVIELPIKELHAIDQAEPRPTNGVHSLDG